jgi:quinohemoprotein ethanol dehydrogenase
MLKLNGMPPSPQMSDDQLEQIRHYLRARAKQAPAEAAALKAGLPPSPDASANQPLPGGM